MSLVTIVTDTEDLAESIAFTLDYETIVELIDSIDQYVGDWDLTNSIYTWASEKHEEYLAEQRESLGNNMA